MNVKKNFKYKILISLKKLKGLKKYCILKKLNTILAELKNSSNFNNKKIILKPKIEIRYILNFIFSPKNTFLYITDVKGRLKRYYSAGSINVKGKQKKNRILMLTRLCRIIKSVKNFFLRDVPIAIHLTNVGSSRKFIVEKLKTKFSLRVIKSYYTYPYNGCRKKKKVRKKQRGAPHR